MYRDCKMNNRCVICNRSGTAEQPIFCNYCYVFIPQIDNGKYIGTINLKCGSCGVSINGAEHKSCPNCDAKFSYLKPPTIVGNIKEDDTRDKNRQLLAQQILNDKNMHEQIINIMGLDRLSEIEQGVALTSLSMEKMHNLSSEYNFTEAHTLIDMGYAMCKEIGEQWAIDLATSRLARFYLRTGQPGLSMNLLTDLLRTMEKSNLINQLRILEIKALLALSHRLIGNLIIADDLINLIYDELEIVFNKIQPEIDNYLSRENHESELLGPSEDLVKYPRVDLIANIVIVMVEEAIAHGKTRDTNLSDEVLNRMLELDNFIDILTKMSPADDTGYFASYLREYVRLFVAIYWYGDLLVKNDDVKRVVLLERAYDIFTQWLTLIPTQFWIPLRPSKFIEIFIRTGKWHDKIDPNSISDFFIENTSSYYQANFRYAIADAMANLGDFEDAMKHLNILLKMDNIEDQFREYAERRKWNIRLESNGILSGVSTIDNRFDLPLSVSFVKLFSFESIIDADKQLVSIDFKSSKLTDNGFALFGERLFDKITTIYPTIEYIDKYAYNHMSWEYGKNLVFWGINDPSDYKIIGHRMEYIIIQSIVRGEPVYLLLEGQSQSLAVSNSEITISPSSLLIIRGIYEQINLELHELVELLIMIMTQDEEIIDKTWIYTMKPKD